MNNKHFKTITAVLLLAALLLCCTSCFSPISYVVVGNAVKKLDSASSYTIFSSLSLSIPDGKGETVSVSEEGRTEYYGLDSEDFTYFSELKSVVEKDGKRSTSGRMEAFEKGTHYLETTASDFPVSRLSASLSKESFLDYLEEDAALGFSDVTIESLCSSTRYKMTKNGAAVVYSNFNAEGLAKFSALTRSIEYLFASGTVLADIRITLTANLTGEAEKLEMEFLYEGENEETLPTLTVENRYDLINETQPYAYTGHADKFKKCDDVRVLRRVDNMLSARRFASEGAFSYTQNVTASGAGASEKQVSRGSISYGHDDGGLYFSSLENEKDQQITKTYKNGEKTTVTKQNGAVLQDRTVMSNASTEKTLIQNKMVPFFVESQHVKDIQKKGNVWTIYFKQALVAIHGVGQSNGLNKAYIDVTVEDGEITSFYYFQSFTIKASGRTIDSTFTYSVTFE